MPLMNGGAYMAIETTSWDKLLSYLEDSPKENTWEAVLSELSKLGTPPDSATEDRAVKVLKSLSSHPRWQIRQEVAGILPNFSFAKVKDTLAQLRTDSTRWVKQSADASYKKLRVSSTIDKRDRKWDYAVTRIKKLKNKYPEITDDMRDDLLKLCVQTGELYFEEVASQALHQVKTLMFTLADAISTADTEFKKMKPLPKGIPEILQEIKTRKENLETLFDSLMNYAKPWEERFTTELAEDIMGKALDKAKATAANGNAKDIKWDIEYAPSLRLECDSNRLIEAMANLIVNALEAMPTGGTLNLSTKATAKGRVQFIVSDTGHGMTAEDFETNKRPGTTGKRKGKQPYWHSGFGLAYTAKAIELGHEGQIMLDTGKKSGTTLIVELPSIREA